MVLSFWLCSTGGGGGGVAGVERRSCCVVFWIYQVLTSFDVSRLLRIHGAVFCGVCVLCWLCWGSMAFRYFAQRWKFVPADNHACKLRKGGTSDLMEASKGVLSSALCDKSFVFEMELFSQRGVS